MTMGFRVTEDDEVTGIDQVQHAETAYDFSGGRQPRRRVPAPCRRRPRRRRKKVDA